MNRDQIKLGVIGTGNIGRTHLKAWAANGINPVALADAVPASLDSAVQEYGGAAFADGAALIASGLANVISICTPAKWHPELAIAALEANIAVLCEKPLARNETEANQIADAVARTGGTLSVGFCHRFQPHVETLKAMIDSGDLGTVMTFRNRFAGHKKGAEKTWFANVEISGGGVMTDTSVHSVDLFRHLIGDPIHVHAFTSSRETPLGPELTVDDTSVMTLQTADGTIGIIDASWRTPPGEWTVTIYGTSATAILDYKTLTLRRIDADGSSHEIDVPAGDRFAREVEHFIDVITTGAEQRVTVADGVWANRILDTGYRSSTNPVPVQR
ncbi:MAG: Gfo/Idh/MocA family oxidoreductase [Thermomicrobiales bacterium]